MNVVIAVRIVDVFCYFQTSQNYFTISLLGSSVLWEVALTVSGDTPPSSSGTITTSAALSVALCSLMASLKPEIDTSSVPDKKTHKYGLASSTYAFKQCLLFNDKL